MKQEGSRHFQCARCQTAFRSYRSQRKYCSQACRIAAAREAIPLRRCPQCEREFRPKVRSAGELQRFCSRPCSTSFHSLEKHPNWSGGRSLDSLGYVQVRTAKNTRTREHRRVAAETLGRPLQPHEQVHHRNEVKTDNRPENLEVLTAQEHARRHPPKKKPRQIECARCHRTRKHHAKMLCRSCYTRSNLEARAAADPAGVRAHVKAQKAASYLRRKAARAAA